MPIETVVFVDVNTVFVFPGYLRGVADEETTNKDRVPLITRDGGESWIAISSKPINFRSIDFISASQGWLVNEQSELSATTDGGVTWALVSHINDEKGSLGYSPQLKFVDSLIGWVLDWQSQSIWHTEDGGKTWVRHVFPNLLFKFFLHGNTCWILSRSQDALSNMIYISSDLGKTWTEIKAPHSEAVSPDREQIESLFFVNEQTGWLTNTNTVSRTDDGGPHWRLQRLPKNTHVSTLFFVDEQNGWGTGWKQLGKAANQLEGLLLRTSDGGDTWQQVDAGERQPSFKHVFFGNLQSGWVVATNTDENPSNDIARIYRTRDGGGSWKRVLSINSPYPSAGTTKQ